MVKKKRLGVSDHMSLWPPFSEPLFGGDGWKNPQSYEVWVSCCFYWLFGTPTKRAWVQGDGWKKSKLEYPRLKVDVVLEFEIWKREYFLVCPLFPPPSVWEWWWTNILQEVSWNPRVAHPTPNATQNPTKSDLIKGLSTHHGGDSDDFTVTLPEVLSGVCLSMVTMSPKSVEASRRRSKIRKRIGQHLYTEWAPAKIKGWLVDYYVMYSLYFNLPATSPFSTSTIDDYSRNQLLILFKKPTIDILFCRCGAL